MLALHRAPSVVVAVVVAEVPLGSSSTSTMSTLDTKAFGGR